MCPIAWALGKKQTGGLGVGDSIVLGWAMTVGGLSVQ